MARLTYRTVALSLAAGLLAPALASAQQSTPSAEARKLLDGFGGEPTVNEVQQAALSYFAMHPEELGRLQGRSGWSNLLPKVQVEVTKELDNTSRVTSSFVDSDSATAKSGSDQEDDDLQVRVRGDWALNELVYSPDELAVLRESRLTAKERQKLLNVVTRVYFERRRAQIDLVTSPPADAKGRALAELKIAELTAELDSLTGGAFSRLSAGGR